MYNKERSRDYILGNYLYIINERLIANIAAGELLGCIMHDVA